MELIREPGAIFRRECWRDSLTLNYERGEFIYRRNGNKEGRPSSTMLKVGDFIRLDKKIGETKMKDLNYIGKDYSLVTLSGRNTFHKADISLDLKEGDLVVVEFNSGFQVCKIKNICGELIDNLEDYTDGKSWVVDKVSTEAHELRKSNTERKNLILRELHRRKKETSEIELFEVMASSDNVAKSLLAEFKKLI